MPVQGSTPALPDVTSVTAGAGGANPYADYMAQFLSYLTDPAAYGKIPNIPDTTVNTTLTSPQTQLAGYGGLNQQAAKLAGTQMSGQLTNDVLANIGTAAAERGVTVGAPGSANANAAYLRALGLDTQQLQQQGIGNYLNLLQTTPRDTTQTQTLSNNVLQSLYAAAPDPMAARLAELGAQYAALMAGQGAGGAPGGGGFNLNPARTPPTSTTTGMPTTTIGAPTSSGWQGPGGYPYTPGGGPANITGQTIGGGPVGTGIGTPSSGVGGVGGLTIGADGSPWINNGDGSWQNASTGEITTTDPRFGTPTDQGSMQQTYNPNDPYAQGMYQLFGSTPPDMANQGWQPLGDGSYYNPNTDEIMDQSGNVYPAAFGMPDTSGGGYSAPDTSGQYDMSMFDPTSGLPYDTGVTTGQEDWWAMPGEDFTGVY